MKLKKCQFRGIFFSCLFKINFIASVKSQFGLVKICFDNCMIRFDSKLNYLDMYLHTYLCPSKLFWNIWKKSKLLIFFSQQNSLFCLENFNFLSPPSPCYWQAYFSKKCWEPYYAQKIIAINIMRYIYFVRGLIRNYLWMFYTWFIRVYKINFLPRMINLNQGCR